MEVTSDASSKTAGQSKFWQILGWIFGLLLFLVAISGFSSSPGSSLFTALMGAVVFPPIQDVIKKKWEISFSRKVKAILFILFMVIAGSLTATQSPTPQKQGASTPAQEAKQTEPEDPNPHFNDGTYIIGKDVQPGTYRTRKASDNCYYSRLSGLGGTLGEIISNENTSYPAVITIEATDKAFKSTRCGTWTKDLSAITQSKTSFLDGIYIVGTDVEPGTYQNSGQNSCYYSRLRGFSGSLGEIISNENTDSKAIVTISLTDKGFKSSRCGTWIKVSSE